MSDSRLPTRLRRGHAAPWAMAAFTLACLAQLRHLESGPDGALGWNLALALVLLCLGLMNGVTWLLHREVRRLAERLAQDERR